MIFDFLQQKYILARLQYDVCVTYVMCVIKNLLKHNLSNNKYHFKR